MWLAFLLGALSLSQAVVPEYDRFGKCMIGGKRPCHRLSGPLAFTTLFTKHTDATGPSSLKIEAYNYISQWSESLQDKGMHGVVLYDDLPHEFISRYSSHSIVFRKNVHYSHRTPNDRRFFMFRDILRSEHHIETCCFSDGRDVKFQHNVLDYMLEQTLKNASSQHIFVGLDHSLIRNHPWFVGNQKGCDGGMWVYGKHRNSRLLNAGFVGGARASSLQFMELITAELDTYSHIDCNMLAFNKVAYDIKDIHMMSVHTGWPLINQLFNQTRDDAVMVMHKGFGVKF